jgi:hypothetical protein
VHDDERRLGFGNERQHFVVSSPARDVVHNRSARLNAARATSAFDVSIEMGTSSFRRKFSITGITRRSSSVNSDRLRAGMRRFAADVDM